MKIGIYIENYRSGGLDRVVIDKINHWPSKYDEFVLFCNDTHAGLPMLKKEIKRDVECVTYPTSFFMRNYDRFVSWRLLYNVNRFIYNTLMCYVSMLWEVPRLMRLFKRCRVNALMIHNGGWPAARTVRSAAIAGRLAKIRTAIIVHGLSQPHHFAISMQERLLEEFMAKIGVEMIAISKVTKECLSDNTRLPPAKIIYSGMRELSNELSSGENIGDIRSDLGVEESAFAIGMFATYEPFRGHLFMLDVMERLLKDVPSTVLLVVGTGNAVEKERLVSTINNRGLQNNVRILGFRGDVARIMTALDVVVQPMQAFASFGLLLVEAMALKRPVVASALGGILEIVEDGKTGLLASHTDPGAFAGALAMLAKDPELCRRMGDAGYKRYTERFRAEQMGNNYYEYVS